MPLIGSGSSSGRPGTRSVKTSPGAAASARAASALASAFPVSNVPRTMRIDG